MKRKIEIEGMRCDHCTASVKEALEAIVGIREIEVHLDEKCAIISGDVSEDTIKEAIDDIGFDVVSIVEV